MWLYAVAALCVVVLFSAGFYWLFIRPYSYMWKPCYGMEGYGVCLPCGFAVHGIDISHHQGAIDWGRLAAQRAGRFPIRFIFMKATEGGDHADDAFRQNFDSAGRYGFIRGAYHYFIPQTDPRKQADFFINTVKLRQGDLPPVLDVETTGRKGKRELQRAVKVWLERVEAHYGVKPILYTSYKFRMRYLDAPDFDAYTRAQSSLVKLPDASAYVLALQVFGLVDGGVARYQVDVEAHDAGGLFLGASAGLLFYSFELLFDGIGSGVGLEACYLVGEKLLPLHLQGQGLFFGRKAYAGEQFGQASAGIGHVALALFVASYADGVDHVGDTGRG